MKNLVFTILVVFIALSSCNFSQNIPVVTNIEKYQFGGEAQGTYYSITYFDAKGRKLDKQIDSLLSAFDLSASNYVDSSIISKVNRNIPVKLDSIFIGNFMLSQHVSQLTNGAFDITVRPLVELWGFGKKGIEEVKAFQVDSILKFTGYKMVRLENGTIVKDDPRLELDFNAIAQGFSVDVVGNYLRSLGIDNFLVDIGGEVYASGLKSDSTKWQVGIEKPKENEAYGESLMAVISLQNRGLATSGNYRKFYEKNGVKYSHTINPKTGYPVRSILLSATVIAETAAFADALATSFMVIGLDSSKIFLQNHPEVDAYLIYSGENGSYKIFQTNGLIGLIKNDGQN